MDYSLDRQATVAPGQLANTVPGYRRQEMNDGERLVARNWCFTTKQTSQVVLGPFSRFAKRVTMTT
jgi:hypothetical protein